MHRLYPEDQGSVSSAANRVGHLWQNSSVPGGRRHICLARLPGTDDCGRTWGIARPDSSNRFAGDHKRSHAGASLPNTQSHRPIGGWSHTVSGAAFWHSVPDELARADIAHNSLILPVLLRISPRLWFSSAQPVFLQENLPVRCHKVDENSTTRTKYWAVPETTSAGTTVAD